MAGEDASAKTGQANAISPTMIWLMMGIAMLGSLATHLIVPSLPKLQKEFGSDYSTIQMLVSFFVIAYGATQIVAGSLADAFGRRRMLLVGLFMFGLASFGCAITTDLPTLIVLRALQGASACFGIVLARAIIRDISVDRNASAMFGYLAVGTSIGTTLAPLIGGLIYERYGWTGPFWFMTIFSCAAIALAWRMIPETATSAAGLTTLRRVPRDFAQLISKRPFLVHCANICLNTALFYSFIVGAVLVSSRDFGLSPSHYGLWFSTTAIGYAVGNIISGRIGRRYPARPTIITGAAFVAISMVVMFILHYFRYAHPAALFLPMAGVTLASGLVMSNSLAGGMSIDPNRTGSASGLLGFLQFASAAAFSSLASFLAESSTSALITLMLVTSLAGMLTAFIVPKN